MKKRLHRALLKLHETECALISYEPLPQTVTYEVFTTFMSLLEQEARCWKKIGRFTKQETWFYSRGHRFRAFCCLAGMVVGSGWNLYFCFWGGWHLVLGIPFTAFPLLSLRILGGDLWYELRCGKRRVAL